MLSAIEKTQSRIGLVLRFKLVMNFHPYVATHRFADGWTSLGVSVEQPAKRISIQSYVQSVDWLPGVMSLSSNSVLLPVQ